MYSRGGVYIGQDPSPPLPCAAHGISRGSPSAPLREQLEGGEAVLQQQARLRLTMSHMPGEIRLGNSGTDMFMHAYVQLPR